MGCGSVDSGPEWSVLAWCLGGRRLARPAAGASTWGGRIMPELSRGAINDVIADRAHCDAEYRQALLADPKGCLARQFRRVLPPWLKVEVVRDTADTVYLVLPYSPPPDGELSDADLEMVGGGKLDANTEISGRDLVCNDATAGVATLVDDQFVPS